MKFVIFALLCSLICVYCEEVADANSDVITLTHANWDETLAANSILLVEFYAPWCGHCKHLAPEYEKAATLLKEKNIRIAKIDADEQANAPEREKYGIQGFPTLKLFRNGVVATDYSGERTAPGIVSWMTKQASPASKELTTVEDTKAFSASDKVVVIGFFDSKDASYEQFKLAANSMRESFTFGEVVGNAAINKEFEVTAPTAILFKKFDEGKNVLTGDFSTIVPFVKANSVPTIDEIGPQNFKSYIDAGLPMAYLFVDLTVEGELDNYLAKIKDIAKESKGKISWVYIDWKKYGRHSERLGISVQNKPSIAIEKPADGTHFVFDEKAEITTDTVRTWINKFLAGEVAPTVKSEAAQEKNDAPVKIIVGTTFDQIVKDPTKDVLVEFYAPWCGHCKKLAPIYDQLGAWLNGVNDVVIAKVDATANDVDPRLGIKGFPTLKLFKAGSKDKPIDYNGDRSLRDLAKFLKDNASVQLSLELPPADIGKKDEL